MLKKISLQRLLQKTFFTESVWFCNFCLFTCISSLFITVEEEQTKDEEEASQDGESEDEGIQEEDSDSEDPSVDPIDCLSASHAVVTTEERVTEEVSPVLQDVLMAPSHLHLPGFEEVEQLALLLLQLCDDGW